MTSQTLVDDLATIRQWGAGGRSVPYPEIDTINVLIGDGTNVLTAGIKAALHVDFNGLLTGAYVHEFDGVTGSAVVTIDKAAYAVGSAPSFASIVGSTPPTVSSARYAVDTTLSGWTTQVSRGDVLRFSLSSVSAFTRLLVALRIRRLEP